MPKCPAAQWLDTPQSSRSPPAALSGDDGTRAGRYRQGHPRIGTGFPGRRALPAAPRIAQPAGCAGPDVAFRRRAMRNNITGGVLAVLAVVLLFLGYLS